MSFRSGLLVVALSSLKYLVRSGGGRIFGMGMHCAALRMGMSPRHH